MNLTEYKLALRFGTTASEEELDDAAARFAPEEPELWRLEDDAFVERIIRRGYDEIRADHFRYRPVESVAAILQQLATRGLGLVPEGEAWFVEPLVVDPSETALEDGRAELEAVGLWI